MLAMGQDSQVAGEYQKMLSADPNDPVLLYLTSRVVHDPDQVTDLLQKAARPPKPFAYALYSLSGLELTNGQFDKAAEHGLQATELSPDVHEMRALAETALLAANRFTDLEKLLEADKTAPYPLCLAAFYQCAYIDRIAGRTADFERDLSDLQTRIRDLGGESRTAQRAADDVRAACDYAVGQTDRFIRPGQDDSPDERLAADLTAGKVDIVSSELTSQISLVDLLATYIVAMQAGKKEIADKALKMAIEAMGKSDYEYRVFAKALAGRSDLPIERLLQYRGEVKTKALVLTALGMKNPQWREPCFALARKLNFDRRYPYLILKKSLGDN